MPPSHGLTGLAAIKQGAKLAMLAGARRLMRPVRGQALNCLLKTEEQVFMCCAFETGRCFLQYAFDTHCGEY